MINLKKAVYFLPLVVCLFVLPEVAISGGDVEEEVEDTMPELEVVEPEIPEIKITENPQRNYCMLQWNEYYKNEGTNIVVSTRGEFDEIVVFSCPDCSLEEHFVDPFLNTRTYGMTGIERIRACGFIKAVFKGSKGIRVVERVIE